VIAVALVVLLAIALDLGGDANDEQAVRFSASDVERVAQRVERMRGLRFEHPVRPLFLSRDEAAKLVLENARSEYPERAQRVDEEGLKLLGLLRPSVDLGKVTEQISEEQVLGFYDDRSGRLVVVRDSGATRPLLEITLAHELVHALEDQRFGLDLPEGVPDDSVLSESALAEGTATSLMVDYADRYLNLGQTLELASLPEAKGLPPFIEKQLLFPYLEGEKFVNVFRGENGEWGPVNAILRFRRPRTSEQILHPRSYAADEQPQHVGGSDLRGALGSGWRRLRATSLGEYDLRLLIDLGGGTRPIAGADGWGGGRFELWRRGRPDDVCRAPCVSRDVAFMRVRWDTAGDRAEAESQLVRVFEKGLRGRRAAAGAGVGVWGSRGATIAMRGRGRETTVVFAPDERLAARALRGSPRSGP
jgi:hypothetical protein